MAAYDERFRAAAAVWRKLTPRWIQMLSDDQTPELAAVVYRITQQPMGERLKHPKDLGEIMVIAHAVVAAEAGKTVTVLIDDGAGARIVTSEISRLQRLRSNGAFRRVDHLGEHADGPETRGRWSAHPRQGHDARHIQAATRP